MGELGIDWEIFFYFFGGLLIVIWLPEVIPALISKIGRCRSDSPIGKVAIADTALSPEGFIKLEERLYFARVTTGSAPPGTELRVVGRKRDRLDVEIIDS